MRRCRTFTAVCVRSLLHWEVSLGSGNSINRYVHSIDGGPAGTLDNVYDIRARPADYEALGGIVAVEFVPDPDVADLAHRTAAFIREVVIPVEQQHRGIRIGVGNLCYPRLRRTSDVHSELAGSPIEI